MLFRSHQYLQSSFFLRGKDVDRNFPAYHDVISCRFYCHRLLLLLQERLCVRVISRFQGRGCSFRETPFLQLVGSVRGKAVVSSSVQTGLKVNRSANMRRDSFLVFLSVSPHLKK